MGIYSNHSFIHTLALSIVGIFCGEMMGIYLINTKKELLGYQYIYIILFSVISGPLILNCINKTIFYFINTLRITKQIKEAFQKYSIYPYSIFLSFALIPFGLKPYFSFFLLLLLLFFILQGGLLYFLADHGLKKKWIQLSNSIPLLFFISGFSALIYQIIWQRVLFSTFGSDTDSVAITVSVFMFGLGIGALFGGQLQKRFPKHLLESFVIIELAIGCFGIVSIPLIHAAGQLVSDDSTAAIIIAIYGLLAFPTLLMGSTLPLLVGYLQERYTMIGTTVGKLYAYNTFGSALAALVTVMLLLTMIGQQAVLVIAAICNFITALLAWLFCQNTHYEEEIRNPDKPAESQKPSLIFPYHTALIISGMIGYIALSLEILWFRIIGFMTANLPQVFGTLLAIYLVGIAYGSLKAGRWMESEQNFHQKIQRALIKTLILTYISAPIISIISVELNKSFAIIIGYSIVGLLAYFSGGILPLLCQISIDNSEKNKGTSVSYFYFSNILGATLGSLITNFIVLDIFPLDHTILFTCIVILFALTITLIHKQKPSGMKIAGGVCLIMVMTYPIAFNNIIGKLQGTPIPLKHINENRHGIITVLTDTPSDIIFGNGAYDGRFNTDPTRDSNGIQRAYMIAALHPHPKRILTIGLSSGSWARVFTLYQPLEELISIDINPGYTDIIRHYPSIAALLQNPKWTHYTNDGRRWLKNNPHERFDAIVMNTTFYWRANATNILSQEFLNLCKQHLNPGGIVYYNTTGARDSIFTAAHVFKHVIVYGNLIAAGDSPFDMTYEQRKKNLLNFSDNQDFPLFAYPDTSPLLEKLASDPLPDIRDSILTEKHLWLITDDNMATEYKLNHAFF